MNAAILVLLAGATSAFQRRASMRPRRLRAAEAAPEEADPWSAQLSELSVIAANQRFYEAFRARSVEAMTRAWAEEGRAALSCIHPGGLEIRGRKAILDSWRLIFAAGRQGATPFPVACEDQKITIVGDLAYCTLTERIGPDSESTPRTSCTNILIQQEGDWRLAVHHAGIVIF